MRKNPTARASRALLFFIGVVFVLISLFSAVALFYSFVPGHNLRYVRGETMVKKDPPPVLDKVDYDRRMIALANYPSIATSTATTTPNIASSTKPWPVLRAPYPNAGALLPFYRIVAYYGNFLSKGMGVLGEYPREEMLAKLKAAAAEWQAADPSTPVVPAIHYIVVTAQAAAGKDGMYRARMSDLQIDHALELAQEVHGVVFLDFQVGLSTVQKELPQYEKYIAMPNVHIGIDPEFSMKDGVPPGREIGTFDAADINWVANYMAGIVKANNLPPKILIVHRFTEEMVTGYKRITPLPEVQIVMDMDGWGFAAKKINTYNTVVASEPVQFTGFKLFYKNDILPPSTALMTPKEVLRLIPRPIYIQYQ